MCWMSPYDTAGEIPDDAVAAHYERAVDVYRELGAIDGGGDILDALIVPGTSAEGIRAWYNSTNHPEHTEGADGAGRPYLARADADDIAEEVLEWDHPTVFATINYQPVDADDWTPYTWDGGREWAGEKPLPEYRDIRGLALFADVDFDAEAKTRPRRRPDHKLSPLDSCPNTDGYFIIRTSASGILPHVDVHQCLNRQLLMVRIGYMSHPTSKTDARALYNRRPSNGVSAERQHHLPEREKGVPLSGGEA